MRALMAFTMVSLIAACGDPAAPSASSVGSATPSPVSSPEASLLPRPTNVASLGPTPDARESQAPVARGWAQDAPSPLLLNTAVRVLVDELNVREKPSTSARRIGIAKADHVLVVAGLPAPVQSDGFVWYAGSLASVDGELPPLPHNPRDVQDGFSGWFAAMKGSTHYVELVAPRCAAADIGVISGMLPGERLACFGHTSIEFEGTYGCPYCLPEIYGEFRPRWLADPNIVNLVAVVGAQGVGLGINVRFPRESQDPPPDGTIIRVRGHFGDAAAEVCRISMADPWGEPMDFDPFPAAVARLFCKQQFVVESYDVVGTDPDFSTP